MTSSNTIASHKTSVEQRYGVKDTETGAIFRKFTQWDAQQFAKAVDKGRYVVVEWTVTTDVVVSEPKVSKYNEALSAARVPGYGPEWEEKR